MNHPLLTATGDLLQHGHGGKRGHEPPASVLDGHVAWETPHTVASHAHILGVRAARQAEDRAAHREGGRLEPAASCLDGAGALEAKRARHGLVAEATGAVVGWVDASRGDADE